MTTPCGCDEAKEWQARALAAEAVNRQLTLSLKFTRRQLFRILEQVDRVIFVHEKDTRIEVRSLTPDELRAAEEDPSAPLTEVHGLDGLMGYAGGTEEERRAAVEAATKGGDRG